VLPRQAFELLFLQYAQKFGLQCRRNIAHLVQEERAFIGQLKTANLLRYGSGERASLAAKSSLSSRSSGMAAQFSLMEGRPHRKLRL
jgi:hypothetical protein